MAGFPIFPFGLFRGTKVAPYARGKEVKILKKGYNILLKGEAEKKIDEGIKVTTRQHDGISRSS